MKSKQQISENEIRRPNWFEATKPGQGRTNWASVPVQLLLSMSKNAEEGVTTTGLKVFCALATHALDQNNPGLVGSLSNGRFRTPGEKRIAAICGLSVRQVLTGIKNLIKHGWIKERKQRYNNTLVLWLAIPDNLDLVDTYGRFKGVPESWTECDIDERSDEQMAREYGVPFEDYRCIIRSLRDSDGSVDMIALSTAIEAYKEKQGNPKAGPYIAVAPLAESASDETPSSDIQYKDETNNEATFDALAYKHDEPIITLMQALRDYIRFWAGNEPRYKRSDLEQFGFNYQTKADIVYDKYPIEYDNASLP